MSGLPIDPTVIVSGTIAVLKIIRLVRQYQRMGRDSIPIDKIWEIIEQEFGEKAELNEEFKKYMPEDETDDS